MCVQFLATSHTCYKVKKKFEKGKIRDLLLFTEEAGEVAGEMACC